MILNKSWTFVYFAASRRKQRHRVFKVQETLEFHCQKDQDQKEKHLKRPESNHTQSIIWTFFIAFTHCYLMWISRTYRGAMFKFLFGSLISASSISKCNYQVVFVSCSCSTTFWTIKSFRIILFLRHKIYLSIYCN